MIKGSAEKNLTVSPFKAARIKPKKAAQITIWPGLQEMLCSRQRVQKLLGRSSKS